MGFSSDLGLLFLPRTTPGSIIKRPTPRTRSWESHRQTTDDVIFTGFHTLYPTEPPQTSPPRQDLRQQTESWTLSLISDSETGISKLWQLQRAFLQLLVLEAQPDHVLWCLRNCSWTHILGILDSCFRTSYQVKGLVKAYKFCRFCPVQNKAASCWFWSI